MIICTKCLCSKSEDEFSYQKQNPNKLYAWCDKCRKNTLPGKPMGKYNKSAIVNAHNRRRLNDDCIFRIKDLYSQGQPVVMIANRLNKTPQMVSRTINKLIKTGELK